eukprot:GHVS01099439.1.p1 GENE.GHVS01099439.1~~GHVS01099439.1.p1  ORF type:complete len:391 (+),score=26.65 GHVS01099439.1:292-1464(+)
MSAQYSISSSNTTEDPSIDTYYEIRVVDRTTEHVAIFEALETLRVRSRYVALGNGFEEAPITRYLLIYNIGVHAELLKDDGFRQLGNISDWIKLGPNHVRRTQWLGGGDLVSDEYGGPKADTDFADAATLSLKDSFEEVMGKNSVDWHEERGSLERVHDEMIGDNRIVEDGESALFYDLKEKELSIFTTKVLDGKSFKKCLKDTGGKFRLSDAKGLSVLQYLTGFYFYVRNDLLKAVQIECRLNDDRGLTSRFITDDASVGIAPFAQIDGIVFLVNDSSANWEKDNEWNDDGDYGSDNFLITTKRYRGATQYEIAVNNPIGYEPIAEALEVLRKRLGGTSSIVTLGGGFESVKCLKDIFRAGRVAVHPSFLEEDQEIRELGSIKNWGRSI